jgi:hypothetical protein
MVIHVDRCSKIISGHTHTPTPLLPTYLPIGAASHIPHTRTFILTYIHIPIHPHTPTHLHTYTPTYP